MCDDPEQQGLKIDEIQQLAGAGLDKRFNTMFAKLKKLDETDNKFLTFFQDLEARLMSIERQQTVYEQRSDARDEVRSKDINDNIRKRLDRTEGMVNGCYADLCALRDPTHSLNLTQVAYLGKREIQEKGRASRAGGNDGSSSSSQALPRGVASSSRYLLG